MQYSGRLHRDLREDFQHTVTVTRKPVDEDQYDDEGRPVAGEVTTDIPALWIEKIQEVQGPNGNKGLVAYVTCYLPHDFPVSVGDKIKNEKTGEERPILQVRPPIFESDASIPYTAWLE